MTPVNPKPKKQKPSPEERSAAALKQQKSVMRSMRFAWEGIMFVFSTQRHMRLHAVIIGLVLAAAYMLGVTAEQFLHLLMAMAVVLITEMINTAVETTVDLTITSYDTRAKVAKDVAAGAVLIAAMYSLAVAAIVFGNNAHLQQALTHLAHPPVHPNIGHLQLVIVGAIFIGLLIGWIKYRDGRGKFWYGGAVSGHSALAFLVATSIAMITGNLAVATLALALALLVLQSRLQAEIHSPIEVVLGGVMGMLVAWVLFMWQT